MTHAAPFFSVITATHLRAPLLERALLSLRAQTCSDFELIVVADALDAVTAEVAARHLREQDLFIKRNGAPGPAASRNMGLDLARGEWLMFLDDDDSLLPHHLAHTQRHILQAGAGPAPQVLFSNVEVVTENREQAPPTLLSRATLELQAHPVSNLYLKNFIPNNALVFRRALLDACRVDPHLESQEDWDFLLAVCARALPSWYPGGGAVVHKDYVNPGNRRGTQTASKDNTVIADFLHVYRRWRAPTPELQAQRQALIKSVGLDLPVSWF